MKPKLIYVEWQDAVCNASWFLMDQAEHWHDETQYTIKECGYVVKEDKRGLTLASRFKPADNNTDDQWGGLQWIPKTWIIKRKNIKI